MSNTIPEDEVEVVSKRELEEAVEEKANDFEESYIVYESKITDYDIEAGMYKAECFMRARDILIQHLFDHFVRLDLMDQVYFKDDLVPSSDNSSSVKGSVEFEGSGEKYGSMRIEDESGDPSVVATYGVIEGREDDWMEKYFSKLFVASREDLEQNLKHDVKWDGGKLEKLGVMVSADTLVKSCRPDTSSSYQ